jgi:hypothetical protein
MIRNIRILQFIILALVLSWGVSFAQDSGTTAKYSFTNNADEEFVFIKLRRTLVVRVSPREGQAARFGIAEYYFKHSDYSDAFSDFKEFARSYPPGEATLLAKVFLYKIALIKNNAELAASFKKEIFDNSFVLLFSKFKILKYKSPFNNVYEVHYYLDKIKVFLNGEVFEEFSP